MLSLLSQEQQARIKHVSIDLTGSADQTSQALKEAKVQVDVVFFYGYITPKGKSAMDPSMADALAEVNVLSNNFYYPQEEALFKHCEKNPGTDWNIVMPFGIVGAVPNAGMNTFLPFAVMAAVQAEKGEPITFGGDLEEWQYEVCHSTARLSGYLSEWAVLEDKCKNERFNAQDGSSLPWNRFFPELARWYGVKEVNGPEIDDVKFQAIELAGGKDCPLGYGPSPAIRLSRTFADWGNEDVNRHAWKRIMDRSEGQVGVNVFDTGFGADMADFVYYKIGQPSVAKLRRFGFNGFVDTMESVFEMYQDMAKMGVIPAPVVDAAKPMI
jgi:hypothetical protein